MTRPVHVGFFGVEDFLHGVPRDCHGYANNSVPIQVAPFQSEALHLPASLGRPVVKIAAIGFNNSIVIH